MHHFPSDGRIWHNYIQAPWKARDILIVEKFPDMVQSTVIVVYQRSKNVRVTLRQLS